MQAKTLDEDDVHAMLVNPFYAISIHPDLVGDHEPMISQAQWIDANVKLLEELGAKAWLERLLAVLQGDFPRQPES